MLVVVVAVVVAAVVTVALGGEDAAPGVLVEILAPSAESGAPTPLFTGTPPAQLRTPGVGISGFAYPLEGACLPEDDSLMPGAAREYRQGLHEGVDFYDSDNCASMGPGAEVRAAKRGTVIRADWAYQDLTAETLAQLLERVREGGGDSAAVADAFRGRQVWVDHGDGIVTRYAHLGSVADGIDIGVEVARGEDIGYVGDSGTPESVTAPGTQAHLHFEIRIGDTFLGQQLDPNEVRQLYAQAFSP